ncbi:MAG: hypothetical protein AVDCRST_MAG52-1183 [uncultured Blastococcus sp.]|uniref:EamA domain-containing protein n=1 Tax=uncultured Blastococcus sp. TaxID=217144 RepID=A0A6J4HT11_9ACTN|nr:MAG: hypothetical protein AVDCRST_MAG52-1183 [uncultured Blastococcus sp.]
MSIAALLAVLSSVAYGFSDVVVGAAVRRHSTAALALWAQLTGLLVLAVVVGIRRPDVVAGSVAWGAAAGALGAAAVLTFYTALQRGSTAIVAPIAGCGVLIPVLAGLAGGEDVGWRAVAGVLAAVVGVLVVAATGGHEDGGGSTAQPERGRHRPPAFPPRGQPVPTADGCVPGRNSGSHRSSVRLATVSALGLGFFFVVLDQATGAAGEAAGTVDTALVVAVAVQVGALLVTVLAAARHTRRCLRLSPALLGPALAVGVLDLAADLFLNVAVGRGPLAVVGPLGSMAPVVAVVVAMVFLRQRVSRGQGVGIVTVLLGIGLIASG